MYGLGGVVGTWWEALEDWVLAIDWLEYGSEEIKLSLQYPWWEGNGYVSRTRPVCGRGGIHIGRRLREAGII